MTMFILHQKVILPDSHGNKEGTITLVPKQITPQDGLAQQVDRVKVSYVTGKGGLAEAWFPTSGDKAITAWVSQKDMTSELEAMYQKKMDDVNAIHEREKLDWVVTPEEIIVKKNQLGEDIKDDSEVPVSESTILVPKISDNIVNELAVLNAKKGVQINKTNDNSDEFQG